MRCRPWMDDKWMMNENNERLRLNQCYTSTAQGSSRTLKGLVLRSFRSFDCRDSLSGEAAGAFFPASSATMVEKGKSRKDEVVTREYTINLHKRLHSCTFKKMAPKAVKEIRKFAQKAMGTTDVRLDVKLNKHIWSRGVRNVPTRVRVRIARKRNDDEDAKEELYSYVSVAEIPAEGLRNLGTKIVEEED